MPGHGVNKDRNAKWPKHATRRIPGNKRIGSRAIRVAISSEVRPARRSNGAFRSLANKVDRCAGRSGEQHYYWQLESLGGGEALTCYPSAQ